MEAIRIPKQMPKSNYSARVNCWISKGISQELDSICEETGLTKQTLTDMLLRKALDVVEIVEYGE